MEVYRCTEEKTKFIRIVNRIICVRSDYSWWQKKKYCVYAMQLKNIVSNWDETNNVEYLRNVAYNISY